MTHFITAVLFDLNETLIHQVRTERSHMASTYAALTQHFWDLTFESFEAAWLKVHARYAEQFQEGIHSVYAGDLEEAKQKLREPWYRENIAAIIEELHLPASNRLIEKVTWAFQDSWVGGLRMPEQNRAVLEQLIQDGYQLGIVTNFQQPDIIPDILTDFGLAKFFKTIVISASRGWRKPHPELFKPALRSLGLSETPGKVVYVGDNIEEDVEGAKRVGLVPVLIDTKSKHGDLKEPVIQIQSLSELPDALLGIRPDKEMLMQE
jgi:HAD superfamily hydrolase (TIGR01549 family)